MCIFSTILAEVRFQFTLDQYKSWVIMGVEGGLFSSKPLGGVNVTQEITRRLGSDSDREFLYVLLRRSLGPHIEATYGQWDKAWQREHRR